MKDVIFEEFNLGFSLTNINEPDMGIAATSSVPSIIRAGFSAKLDYNLTESFEFKIRGIDWSIHNGVEYWLFGPCSCRFIGI